MRVGLARDGRARLRAAVVLAVACIACLAAGAQAALGQGTLEVCKSTANGMSGRVFTFSVNGGAPVTVKGGRCSGPMTVAHGNVTVTELATTPATEVDSIVVRPSARNLGLNGNTAQVSVPAGSTAANETRITFTNVPGGGPTGDFKVCKLTETQTFVGRLYTFHLNGGPGVSVEANNLNDDPSLWSCRLLGTFTQGTVVTLDEDIPAGQELAFIDSDPGSCLVDGSQDTNTGTAQFTIGSGACVALYQNEPAPPSGAGFIEVCKDAALVNGVPDPFVLGRPFDFQIDDGSETGHQLTVLGGQCSAPVRVAAGRVVARCVPKPIDIPSPRCSSGLFEATDIFTIPDERLLDSNLINETAQVEVPASDDPGDETQLHFVNRRLRAQLKLCKALGAGSNALVGKEFVFNVTDLDGFQRDPLNPRITAASSTQCVIVGEFPTGDRIEITEQNPGAYVDVTGEGTYTIQPGINSATITNTARGKLEICKFVTDPLIAPETDHQFTFHIDSGKAIKVRPGRCSPPQLVSVGPHVVTEGLEANYELDPGAPGSGITVTPPDAETSRNLLARSVTVTVPWAGDPNQSGREVRVDYYNRIKRAQIKICKHIEPGSTAALGSKEFDFIVTTTDPTHEGPYLVSGVAMEECALVRDGQDNVVNVRIIGPDGQATFVQVIELDDPQAPGSFIVSNISVQGVRDAFFTCFPGVPPTCLPFAFVFPGPNTNTVHFTNRTG